MRGWHTLPLAEINYCKAHLQQICYFFKNLNVKKFKGFMKKYLGHFHWGICQCLGSIPTMLLNFSVAKDLSVVLSNQQAKRHVSVRKSDTIRRSTNQSHFEIRKHTDVQSDNINKWNICVSAEKCFTGIRKFSLWDLMQHKEVICAAFAFVVGLFVISKEGRCLESCLYLL